MVNVSPGEPCRLDVWLLRLSTVDRLGAAHDGAPPEHRELVALRLSTADADGRFAGPVGWGECSALNRPTYSGEWAAGCFDALRTVSDSSLAAAIQRCLRANASGPAASEGGDIEPIVGAGGDRGPIGPMARAGLEMAAHDLVLRERGQSLARRLWGDRAVPSVPAGVALGLDGIDASAERAATLAAAGYRRIKMKIAPGHLTDAVRAVMNAAPGVEIQVDANGSLDRSHRDALVAMAALGVAAFEQPFAAGDVDAARDLINRVEVPVVGDEAVGDLADVQRLAGAGALTGVSIKAPRLGGIVAAAAMARWCEAEGIAATAGGMLESGLGRHALAALAAGPAFTVIGDVSPARRWLAIDPFPDIEMFDGAVAVPDGPGIAPIAVGGPDLGDGASYSSSPPTDARGGEAADAAAPAPAGSRSQPMRAAIETFAVDHAARLVTLG